MLHTKFRGNWPAGYGEEEKHHINKFSFQSIMYLKAYLQNLVKNGP